MTDRNNPDRVDGVGAVVQSPRNVPQLNRRQISDLAVQTREQESSFGSAAAAIALALVGQSERRRDNHGPIVGVAGGRNGAPWCASFARFVFNAALPGVYDQKDAVLARSFMRHGLRNDAFNDKNSDYEPKIGDAVVFSRSNNPTLGHVGIVTGYDRETGALHYVSGNDDCKDGAMDVVQMRTFNLNSPPRRLLGFTDSYRLSVNKGVGPQCNNELTNDEINAVAMAQVEEIRARNTGVSGEFSGDNNPAPATTGAPKAKAPTRFL